MWGLHVEYNISVVGHTFYGHTSDIVHTLTSIANKYHVYSPLEYSTSVHNKMHTHCI